MTKLSQRDRVSFSLGAAGKEFGRGFDVHVSYSTDVGKGETPKEAVRRAEQLVATEVNRLIEEYEIGLKRKRKKVKKRKREK